MIFLILISTAMLAFLGCASVLEKQAIEVIGKHPQGIEKRVLSRRAQLDVRVGFLNEDMVKYRNDEAKLEEIKAEIEKLHEEQKFLYTVSYEQFKLDYDVVKELEDYHGLKILVVQVKGKTLFLNEEGRSKILDIPEKESNWVFYISNKDPKSKIHGPILIAPDQLEKLLDDEKKSPEN